MNKEAFIKLVNDNNGFEFVIGYKDVDCPENPMHNKRKDISELVEYR